MRVCETKFRQNKTKILQHIVFEYLPKFVGKVICYENEKVVVALSFAIKRRTNEFAFPTITFARTRFYI